MEMYIYQCKKCKFYFLQLLSHPLDIWAGLALLMNGSSYMFDAIL